MNDSDFLSRLIMDITASVGETIFKPIVEIF